MQTPIHVLSVGFPAASDILEDVSNGRFRVISVANPQAALECLDRETVNCVVSTDEFPAAETAGVGLLAEVRDRHDDLPFVLVPESGSERLASAAIAAGVTDYIPRSALEDRDGQSSLADRLEGALERAVGRQAHQPEAHQPDEATCREYRTLVETVGDPMYILDERGHCTMVNDAMVEYTGWDREDVIGTHISAYIGQAAFEEATEMLLSALEEAKTDRIRAEFPFQNAAGEERVGEAHMTALTDDGGRLSGSVGVVRDISRRKERERELARYETIIETAPIGLFVLDEAGRLTWMNDAFIEAFEEDEDKLEGVAFPELVERGYYDEEIIPRYLEMVRQLLSSTSDKEKIIHDTHFVTPEGEERIYDAHTGLLPLEDGEFQGTVNAFRDITTRKKYQRELERQNQQLERFASLVSHDLRGPLTVAHGHADLLAETGEYDQDSIDYIRRAVERMDELIETLLALARQGQSIGETEPVRIDRVAKRAWNGVETAEASLEMAKSLEGTIEADESRLRELFENCFRNSVEHGGDAVTVTVGRLSGTRTGNGFFIADDGQGVEGDLETIFEPGVSHTEQGTGLGLSIVKQIVEAHDWTIRATAGDAGGLRLEIRGAAIRVT